MADCIVKVNGKRYEGWKAVTVQRSIEAAAAGFQITFTDAWSGSRESWGINPQNEIEIILDGNLLVRGYIDSLDAKIGPTEREFTVKGRDKTGDLADCSAELKPSEYLNISLLDLVEKMTKGYGIEVKTKVITSAGTAALREKFPVVRIEPGQSIWECIEEHSRYRGLLMFPDGRGNLLLTEPGTNKTSEQLVEGENILNASFSHDVSKRYSLYTVLSQNTNDDESEDWESTVTEIKGEAKDKGISRKRVLIIRSEKKGTVAAAEKRAQWEATVRAARALKVTVTVQGWSQFNGDAWPINAVVQVSADKSIGASGSFIISSTNFRLDSGGTFTDLELIRPDAFIAVPEVVKKQSDQKSVGWKWPSEKPAWKGIPYAQ